jgi:peptide alpha-N-acetyltransferase
MAAADPSTRGDAESAREEQLPGELNYIQYQHSLEAQYLPAIRALISKDLSEPYSIYVYRYFLYQWGHLCYMVRLAAQRSLLICLF